MILSFRHRFVKIWEFFYVRTRWTVILCWIPLSAEYMYIPNSYLEMPHRKSDYTIRFRRVKNGAYPERRRQKRSRKWRVHYTRGWESVAVAMLVSHTTTCGVDMAYTWTWHVWHVAIMWQPLVPTWQSLADIRWWRVRHVSCTRWWHILHVLLMCQTRVVQLLVSTRGDS